MVGGLVVSQALTLFTISVSYPYMDWLSELPSGFGRRRRRLSDNALFLAATIRAR